MSLVLLAGLLASIVTLTMIAIFALRGEFCSAGKITLRWGICAAAYGATLVAAGMAPRDSGLKIGAPYCDDDMCMSVEHIGKTPQLEGATYRLDVRLFTLANHGSRTTKGASVYLTDERNRRFPAIKDNSVIPFDVDVDPGRSVNTSLTFHVPSDAHTLEFAAGMDHIQYASFIIGNGDLLHHPRLRLRIP